MIDETIRKIRELEAERTKYKSIVESARYILRKTCGSCGHIGVQCHQDRNAVEKITVEQWFKEPEKHVCDDWRFSHEILTNLREVLETVTISDGERKET